MRNLFFLLITTAIALGCKEEKRNSKEESKITRQTHSDSKITTKHKSILDYEYINDTLALRIIDIRVSDEGNSDYEIEVIMETGNVEKYSKNHKFFIHCYYYEGMETKNFMPIGTNRVKVLDNVIKYSRKFKSHNDIFKVMRYGLLNTNTNERYFTLKIDSVDFYKQY